jgi:hypothetical protein
MLLPLGRRPGPSDLVQLYYDVSLFLKFDYQDNILGSEIFGTFACALPISTINFQDTCFK